MYVKNIIYVRTAIKKEANKEQQCIIRKATTEEEELRTMLSHC